MAGIAFSTMSKDLDVLMKGTTSDCIKELYSQYNNHKKYPPEMSVHCFKNVDVILCQEAIISHIEHVITSAEQERIKDIIRMLIKDNKGTTTEERIVKWVENVLNQVYYRDANTQTCKENEQDRNWTQDDVKRIMDLYRSRLNRKQTLIDQIADTRERLESIRNARKREEVPVDTTEYVLNLPVLFCWNNKNRSDGVRKLYYQYAYKNAHRSIKTYQDFVNTTAYKYLDSNPRPDVEDIETKLNFDLIGHRLTGGDIKRIEYLIDLLYRPNVAEATGIFLTAFLAQVHVDGITICRNESETCDVLSADWYKPLVNIITTLMGPSSESHTFEKVETILRIINSLRHKPCNRKLSEELRNFEKTDSHLEIKSHHPPTYESTLGDPSPQYYEERPPTHPPAYSEKPRKPGNPLKNQQTLTSKLHVTVATPRTNIDPALVQGEIVKGEVFPNLKLQLNEFHDHDKEKMAQGRRRVVAAHEHETEKSKLKAKAKP